MLKKSLAFLSVLGILGLIVFSLNAFSGIDEGTVTDPAFERKTRGTVAFDHDMHMDAPGVMDCATCHHYYEDGVLIEFQSSEGLSCSECHMGSGGDTLPLIEAYHQQCRSCHIEQQAGPVTCAGCHVKP
ncbi:class III cytochrome C family protein [Desulfobotulus alkaliphilus]|uniref:Class III cytochrome C family protein n=1 Tax=Desulfobotulus alkaliphilus TaxID=622671 RepID=A0A562RKF8_9BACT|nr:cytochrome c3 family protein [Desulfobotulus alkaliphilus]TWI68890.1 class III cytochrome C family protein [Desulfobotulus alkaliphilus]